MADIYYPHDYLPAPKREDGTGFQPVSPLKRTTMTSGRARQRRAYTSVPTQSDVTWLFKEDGQAQLFEAFYREDLTDGSAWFYMKLKTPLGIQPYKCRFVDIYQGPTIVNGRHWQFSATLELWERPILPPGWSGFPDFVVNQSIIDIALNREWPKA